MNQVIYRQNLIQVKTHKLYIIKKRSNNKVCFPQSVTHSTSRVQPRWRVADHAAAT